MGLWQFQVSPRPGQADPVGREAAHVLADFGIHGIQAVHSTRLFTIDLPDLGESEAATARRIAEELLTDPVAEHCRIESGSGEVLATANMPEPSTKAEGASVEVHLKPGVMDNVANSTQLALQEMGIEAISIRTGRRYKLSPAPVEDELKRIPRLLGNDCIEDVMLGHKAIEPAPQPPAYAFELRTVAIRDLDDAALERLSREGHLFLSLAEMRTIRDHYQAADRDPTDLELEMLAQTWSEHCVHKTLKSAVAYEGAPFPLAQDSAAAVEPGARITQQYTNLLKDTIARGTDELMQERVGPECLSVFVDNAGVIAFDDDYGVAFKVETHNHPSAIEPYGGAATGAGGCIRDIMGCGLGAKPIANTDIFCVAQPTWPVDAVPKGVTHPKRILKGIVAGVRDYGNQMGIPTVNGAIQFDPRYLGNPLVYCGCVGLIPRDRIHKAARPGDAIVVMGGRTGRDGIHGATFSSAELTDTHEDEFAHAVQIGNPIEEKKVLDVLLQARDYPTQDGGKRCLYSAVTDCGAGGLSSAVGEMGEETGAEVHLERVPLKYAGLRYDEIWISEAQERMVFAVPPQDVETILELARSESVEATVIGEFTGTGELVVRYNNTVVGRLDMQFLHNGLPKIQRKAEWTPIETNAKACGCDCAGPATAQLTADRLKEQLSDPNIASKHWVIRQYDHEVQAGSVIKPLAGQFDGPSDAAVVRPRLTSSKGVALGCGLAPQLTEVDPYWAAVAAIDEAVRNVVCVGGDPTQTAVLDNFCWPRVDNPRGMGELVRACQACYDMAKAYGIPFVSGKDSLNNEFALDAEDVDRVRKTLRDLLDQSGSCVEGIRDGRVAIPGTLLISAMSLVEDVARCITMDAKHDGARLYLVGHPTPLMAYTEDGKPAFNPRDAAETHRTVAAMIRKQLVSAVHDVSDGGPVVAIAEMCMASDRSCRVHTGKVHYAISPYENAMPAMYVVEVEPEHVSDFIAAAGQVPCEHVATILEAEANTPIGQGRLEFDTAWDGDAPASVALANLRKAWKTPLDW